MKRSLIFWMWNAPLKKEELRRQIADMHRKHIGGFFIHPMPSEFRAADFPGGMPGYLSEEYFQMVRYAVECAAEYDMDAWLYDEGGWPSGTVNGLLMQEHPELATRFINAAGEIQYSAARPDLLNPETTRIFIEMVHEKYRRCMGEYFGNVIPGIFTDEPSFGSLRAGELFVFSPLLEERFKADKHYDAREAAMRMLQHNDPQARQDLNEVWSALIIENFLTPIKEWCHKNNLLFTGHFNGDDCVDNMEILLGSDIFSLLQQLDVPGCDAIWRQIHPLTPETDFSRITSSAAGNKMTISETFAVYGTDLSLAEMKYTAAMQFIAGINIVAPMALHYSNEGGRQITTVSNFYGEDPRWEQFSCYSDFVIRMSKLFDGTEPVIKCSVPFPRTQLRRGECADRDVFGKGLALAKQQITYDYRPDIPEFNGTITKDIELTSPCPALRTRHLRSPHDERRIFVNSQLDEISFSFKSPAGFNVWYDPATGRRQNACPDENGLLEMKLPFAGCMVLLTTPGCSCAVQKKCSTVDKEIPVDFKFAGAVREFKASANGLREVPPGKVDENFCGTLRYEARLQLLEARRMDLCLPGARRAICSLQVNGRECGIKNWQPYSWEVELEAGENILILDVTGTPAAAFHSPEHLEFLKQNNFDNVYFKRCMDFEKIFPDEDPAAGAILKESSC